MLQITVNTNFYTSIHNNDCPNLRAVPAKYYTVHESAIIFTNYMILLIYCPMFYEILVYINLSAGLSFNPLPFSELAEQGAVDLDPVNKIIQV